MKVTVCLWFFGLGFAAGGIAWSEASHKTRRVVSLDDENHLLRMRLIATEADRDSLRTDGHRLRLDLDAARRDRMKWPVIPIPPAAQDPDTIPAQDLPVPGGR